MSEIPELPPTTRRAVHHPFRWPNIPARCTHARDRLLRARIAVNRANQTRCGDDYRPQVNYGIPNPDNHIYGSFARRLTVKLGMLAEAEAALRSNLIAALRQGK